MRDAFSRPVEDQPWPGDLPAPAGHALTIIDPDARPHDPAPLRVLNVQPEDGRLAWYLARATTRQETRAERNLIEQGFTVYVPRAARWRDRTRPGAPRVRTESSLFGGYFFVGLGPTRALAEVEDIEAVHAIVRFSRETYPRQLPFEAIFALLLAELAGDYDKTRRNQDRRKDPPKGTPVKVTHGQFAGWPAQFVGRREDERIALLLTMFGKETPFVVDPEDVELPEVKG